jgi:acetyl-CoA carboxylase biotin carboxyl carrier protein
VVSASSSGPTQGAIAGPAHSAGDYTELTEAVRQLVQVMRDGGIGQLDVRQGDLRISLKSARVMEFEHSAVEPTLFMQPMSTDAQAEPAPTGQLITSPMIGTYYSAPGPNERPFVQVGDRVEIGQTVAIIEAMKIMNEIVSEYAGTVTELIVKNGEAVEYGHPLIRLHE